MEMQVANLRTQMEKSNTKAEGLQQTLEDLRRQLTIKESELTEAGRFFVMPKSLLAKGLVRRAC